jgi:hypothetical protein
VFFAIFGLEFPKPQITHPDMIGTSDDVGFRGFLWIFVLEFLAADFTGFLMNHQGTKTPRISVATEGR